MKQLLSAGLLLALSCPAWAAIELPRMFADGAVLQRDQALPVWGSADPGASVSVELDGQQAQGKADARGHWLLSLPAHAAGGPYTLTVRSGEQTRVLHDVLLGDVWLASGQSNMEFELYKAGNGEAEIASAHDDKIRHFKIPKSWSGQPEDTLAGGQWQAATPQNASQFSAIGYFFARELRASTGVPIGIIDSSWGGSSIEAWMDAGALEMDAKTLAAQGKQMRAADERDLAVTRQHLARWPQLPADDRGWQAEKLDLADWTDIQVPALWETVGWAGLDGVAWYRTNFELSAAQAKAGVKVSFGRVDDSDQAWVNGTPVGATHRQYDARRIYAVPASVLHAGTNVLAVQATDEGGGGGLHGTADELYVETADGKRIALPRQWKFRVASAQVTAVDGKNQIATLLYNKMIHPLQPYAIKGVIWYQGESNATLTAAPAYAGQFKALIGQWRSQWHAPQLPFLWVQLANFSAGADTDTRSPWAELRAAQSSALSLPATGQAVSIDVGNPTDIHPTDKQTVGHRLALVARKVAYGQTLVDSGPTFADATFAAGKARVAFDLHGSALAVRAGDEQLHGFTLAGADHRFHPAQARLEGDRVVVHSDAVPQPQAVRYGWSENPAAANLINAAGLPASPFRSDTW